MLSNTSLSLVESLSNSISNNITWTDNTTTGAPVFQPLVFQPPVLPLPGTLEFEHLVDAVVKRISELHPEVIEDAKSRRRIKKAVGRMLRPVK
jgi:hypothetical protein